MLKEKLYALITEAYPKGVRKRELFPPTDVEGHKAIDELVKEGLIEAKLYNDPANIESYYLYYWKNAEG